MFAKRSLLADEVVIVKSEKALHMAVWTLLLHGLK